MSLWIYQDEGEDIPHMHIRRKGKNDICVKFYKAEYFIHRNKTDKLSQEEKEWLDSILRQKAPSGRSYWKFAIEAWNNTNVIHDDKLVSMRLKQPDYTKLE